MGGRFMSAGFVTRRPDDPYHLRASPASSEDRAESQHEHARRQPAIFGRTAASAAASLGQADALGALHVGRATGRILGLADLRADRAAGRCDAQIALAELRIRA